MLALGLLFAEAEAKTSVSFADIGMVLTALAVILLVIDRVKTIFWPSKPMDEEYVRKAELSQELTEIKTSHSKYVDDLKIDSNDQIKDLKEKMETFVTRLELQRLESQILVLVNDHKDLVKWTATKYDDMSRSISDLRVSIEQVRREIRVETDNAADKIIRHIAQQGLAPRQEV